MATKILYLSLHVCQSNIVCFHNHVRVVVSLCKKDKIHTYFHITGGGMPSFFLDDECYSCTVPPQFAVYVLNGALTNKKINYKLFVKNV